MLENKIEHQKNVAREVLVKVKNLIDSGAIIAGGAPRNWVMGKEANDIDLYLRSYCNTSYRVKRQLEKALGVESLEYTQDYNSGSYAGIGGIEIVKLISFNYRGVLFQMIYCNPAKSYRDFGSEVVNHMDVGLSRISCDWYSNHDTNIDKTSEFLKDLESKTLTLYSDCMTASQLEHCLKNHLPKMVRYFPDYELKIV